MKWLLFAFRNVGRNRRRALITVLITAVGTAAILIGGGFALYTYESLREAAARDSGHLILAHKEYFDREEDTPMSLGLDDFAAAKQALLQDDRVRAVLPRLHFSGLISNGDKSSVFIGTGVDAATEFHVKGPFMKMLGGEVLSASPTGPLPEVMLGEALAKQLNAKPGSVLTLLSTTTEGSLNALDVTVRGVFSLGVPDIDKRAVYVALGTAQKLLVTDRASLLAIYLTRTEDTAAMRGEVSARYPSRALQTWEDQAYYYVAVRSLYNRIFGLLGAIMVVIVLFAVSNTMAMAVVERTREIGTLRALGTLPAQIVRVFALEGWVLGSAGALAGVLVALATAGFFAVAGFQMPPPPGRSDGYPLFINVDALLYVLAAVAVIGVSTVAAWLMSRKAARKPIVEALTHV
ncbi:MAG: ABC transporter permease [Betaproteobacteria bacterium]|nr:ABC transporter permease [Betaproteobacteria bacterium]